MRTPAMHNHTALMNRLLPTRSSQALNAFRDCQSSEQPTLYRDSDELAKYFATLELLTKRIIQLGAPRYC
jgi:hypothetical protein